MKIRGKNYKWNVEKMHPVAFWVMIGGGLSMGVISLWCTMALFIALMG